MRIKEVIKEKNTTVKALAEKMGIAPPSLSLMISGNPTVETLNRIAAALEVPVTELFDTPTGDTINCPHCGGKIRIEKE